LWPSFRWPAVVARGGRGTVLLLRLGWCRPGRLFQFFFLVVVVMFRRKSWFLACVDLVLLEVTGTGAAMVEGFGCAALLFQILRPAVVARGGLGAAGGAAALMRLWGGAVER